MYYIYEGKKSIVKCVSIWVAAMVLLRIKPLWEFFCDVKFDWFYCFLATMLAIFVTIIFGGILVLLLYLRYKSEKEKNQELVQKGEKREGKIISIGTKYKAFIIPLHYIRVAVGENDYESGDIYNNKLFRKIKKSFAVEENKKQKDPRWSKVSIDIYLQGKEFWIDLRSVDWNTILEKEV